VAKRERKPNELEEAVAYGLQHALFDGQPAAAALRYYQSFPREAGKDVQVVEWLLSPVRRHRDRVALGKEPPFLVPQLPPRPLVLGEDTRRAPVTVHPQTLTAGTLLLGNTGASKTTFATWLLYQLASLVSGLWCADMYKEDLRRLRFPLRDRGVDLVVVPVRQGKWNPLQPDGDLRSHQSWVGSLLARLLPVGDRARQILQHGLHTLYARFGLREDPTRPAPTLFDLFEWVRTQPGLNVPARDALLDRLAALLVSMTSRALAWRRAWRPRDLAQFPIVFEMRGVAESGKHLVLSSLLFSILYERAERGVSNDRLNLVCVFEDAQRFLTASGGGDLSPIDELGGLIRGLGVGLVCACQSVEGLSPQLVPNLATKFLGRCGKHADWFRMGQDMGLTPEQLQWAKLHLGPGLFVGSCADASWRHPFVLRTPHFRLEKVVSDAEVAESQRRLDSLPTEFASEFARWEPYPTVAVQGPGPVSDPIGDAELRLLGAIVADPGLPSSRYAKLARLQVRRAVAARQTLIDAGLVREHTVQSSARGRPALVLEPTAEGISRARGEAPIPSARGAA